MNYFLELVGCGIYHSTVNLFDTEYSFGFCENKIRSGIYQADKQANRQKFVLKEKIFLGFTLIEPENLYVLIDYISRFWMTTHYHPFNKNCNSFSYVFAKMLLGEVCFPSYVNRFVQSYHFLECIYEKFRILSVDSNPSSITENLQSNIQNNLTNDLMTRVKNTDNNQKSDVTNTKEHNQLKMNENFHSNSLMIKKEMFDDEDFRDFGSMRRNLEALGKLNIIESNLSKSILNELANIINNKFKLSEHLFVDITNYIYASITLSHKHFKQDEFEKTLLLNKVLEETIMFLKKVCERYGNELLINAVTRDHSEISVILIKLNLKIYERVPDHKVFITHCNKIFKEIKAGNHEFKEPKAGNHEDTKGNLSNLSNSEMKLHKTKSEDQSFLFNRKYKMNC